MTSLLKLENSSKMVLIDIEDKERLKKYRWFTSSRGAVYRIEMRNLLPGEIPIKASKHRRTLYIALASEIMHQLDQMFDHKDRNSFDCRKENLRPCTYSQNAMNRKKIAGCSSKYKGVSWSKYANKWQASIKLNGKKIMIGRYANEDEAGLAYNQKALELFKEFACLNEII